VGYIDVMQETTRRVLQTLHRDVSELIFVDIPDHPNVGDAAIALGQMAFWRESGIEVSGIYSKGTVTPAVFSSQTAVAIQGGGNLGGLYPAHDQLRFALAEQLPARTVLIQQPQSVHFSSVRDETEFAERFASRSEVRIAVRDNHSYATLSRLGMSPVLSPDAAHMLGAIDAEPASQRAVFLLRRDKESDETRTPSAALGVDWRPRTLPERVGMRLRARGAFGVPPRAFNPSKSRWLIQAARRLDRGVALLSQGETIVTNRLHAMIIGLQMGRRVIAIDNNVKKLHRYAETWFTSEVSPSLLFADSLDDARSMLD